MVPKVSENKGLNFLNIDAEGYLDILKDHLKEKGHIPDKPIAFLCNPPYRNDDDQGAASVGYSVHDSIIELTGKDASSERYCCFLAQMMNICRAAKDSGLPDESLLLIFSKTAWLTKRPIFEKIRHEILSEFEDVGGFLIKAKEFFDLKGKFPIAFTVWKYKGENSNLNSNRSIQLFDLTWMTKKDLKAIPWDNPADTDKECYSALNSNNTIKARLGEDRKFIDSTWCGTTLREFQRDRRKAERDDMNAGGLPLGDNRRLLKKTYGEQRGTSIGFMDDLTPCRIKPVDTGKPWFRLNKPFMDCRKTRCFSGPPDQKGYEAKNSVVAKKLFLWFSLSRTFETFGYPMWCDNDKLWIPAIPDKLSNEVNKLSYAIGFADNECIETYYPANNPIVETRELFLSNPMTPLDPESFWNTDMKALFDHGPTSIADELVDKVNHLYSVWNNYFKDNTEIIISYEKPYFIEGGVLTKRSGLRQIVDYARENKDEEILDAWSTVQESLKKTKENLYSLLIDEKKINYFGMAKIDNVVPLKVTVSKDVIQHRTALASYIVNELNTEKTFGRIKFAKIFYLLDSIIDQDLETTYYREAAGPLDPYSLYNQKTGIEKTSADARYFYTKQILGKSKKSKRIKYVPGENMPQGIREFQKYYRHEKDEMDRIVNLLKKANTEQCEIVATLYACWNDMLIDSREITGKAITEEFYYHWHKEKKRFDKDRLLVAIKWMRDKGLAPTGRGKKTNPNKPPNQDDLFEKESAN